MTAENESMELPEGARRSTSGLRDTLFDELDMFRSGKTSPKHAQTVVNLARAIIDTSRLEIVNAALSMQIAEDARSERKMLGSK